MIHGYELLNEWTTTANGSYTFGKKGSKEYFLKKLPQPKYPNPKMLTGETFKRKKEACEEWERKREKLISALQKAAAKCAFIIAPTEYFMEGNSYYITSPRVSEKKLSVEEVAALDKDTRLAVIKKYAYALEALAENNIVHGDIKHSNVFVVKTYRGYEPRFIDFDDSYFSGEPPDPESTIGSPEFYSPELGKYIMSDDPSLKGIVTCKSDVFASAIMFHDYYTGKRMLQRRGKYPFQIDSSKDMIMAVASGDLKELIKSMMEVDADKRADSSTVLSKMIEMCPTGSSDKPPSKSSTPSEPARKPKPEPRTAPKVTTGERMIPGKPKWTYIMADGTERMLPPAVARGMAEDKGIPIVGEEEPEKPVEEKKTSKEEVVKSDDKYVWVKKGDGTISKLAKKIYDAIMGDKP